MYNMAGVFGCILTSIEELICIFLEFSQIKNELYEF